MTRAEQALLGVVALTAIIAAPALAEQWAAASEARRLLAGLSREDRAAALDNPAVPVAREIAAAVPEDGCVTVLAYAGPAAIDYYNPRLDYLLYPRRVQVFADSAAAVEAAVDGCEYVAVFRDTPQNLAAEPFAGTWEADALDARLRGLKKVGAGAGVAIYRQAP